MKQNFAIENKVDGAMLARLGASHGYRFETDNVTLNAMFTTLDARAEQQAWALQLWACSAAPDNSADVGGHLVAEVPLPPMNEIADDAHNFEVTVPAVIPAGQNDFIMVLALASGSGRKFDTVHDFFVYGRRERFFQPRMGGDVGYQIEGDQVRISVGQIENPRAPENLSGTLAVELWALPAPYGGGAFQGSPVAGVAFSGLAGGQSTFANSFVLPFTKPAAGQWHFTIMLREWTAQGFVTRDYATFAPPVVVAPPAQPEAVAVAPEKAGAPAEKPATPVAQSPATTKAKSVAAPKARAAKGAKTAPLSVNSASAAEIAAAGGLPSKVAESIVKTRPFASLDELQKIKGIGVKVLAKLRSRFKL